MDIIFDANALIALFRDEPGADIVENYLTDDRYARYMHVINLCEVYYEYRRSAGEAEAQKNLNSLREYGLIFRYDMDDELWQEAGKIKADYRRISLADCFCVALTNRLRGKMISSDRSELAVLADTNVSNIEFFR